MDKNNRNHSSVTNDDDKDDKLKQYQIINTQLSKTIADQKRKICNLTNDNKTLSVEMFNHQNESIRWKNKFVTLRQMYINFIHSTTGQLQLNAERINALSDDIEGSEPEAEMSRSATVPTASKSIDPSRRVSKNFEPTKPDGNASPRSDEDPYLELDTITEETEEEGEQKSGYENEEESDHRNEQESDQEMEEGSHQETDHGSEDKSGQGREEESWQASEEESGQDSEEESGQDSEEESSDQSVDGSDHAIAEVSKVSSVVEENETNNAEEISLVASSNHTTIINVDSNKENEWPSSVSNSVATINDGSQSVVSVSSQSLNKSKAPASFNEDSQSVISISSQSLNKSKAPASAKRSFITNRLVSGRVKHLLQDPIENRSFVHMQTQGLVSSTPYKNKNPIDTEKLSPAKLRSRSSVASSSTASSIGAASSIASSSNQVQSRRSRSNVAISVVDSVSTRPKRKASPINFTEPKLNTKLRRPRK